MTIAIIPARGGSKRIPRKNIRDFCGKPLMGWSIEAARKAEIFDRIIVSTDDDEIASIAIEYGAEVLERPVHLADDHTGTGDVIRHAVEQIGGDSLVACLYANPFTEANDLKRALTLMRTGAWDYAFAATTFAYPIFRAFSASPVQMFFTEHFTTRSQDLPQAWHDAGQFYFAQPSTWLHEPVIFTRKSRVVEIPRFRVQDIDTPEDWTCAEFLWRALKGA